MMMMMMKMMKMMMMMMMMMSARASNDTASTAGLLLQALGREGMWRQQHAMGLNKTTTQQQHAGKTQQQQHRTLLTLGFGRARQYAQAVALIRANHGHLV
jgi:hypothetical protein